MPSGAFSQNGLQNVLFNFASTVASTPYVVGLYVNDIVITPASTFSDIEEASFMGYVRQNMGLALAPVWNPVTETYMIQFEPLTFFYSGLTASEPVYGWFAVANDDVLQFGDLLYVSGQSLSPSFPQISFIPAINIGNE